MRINVYPWKLNLNKALYESNISMLGTAYNKMIKYHGMQLTYMGELNKHVIHSEGQKNLTGTTGINNWPNDEVNWK